MHKHIRLIQAIWIIIFVIWAFPAPAEMIVDTAWVRIYNGPANAADGAYAIAIDVSGNVYVTGQSWDSVTFEDCATIKYYPNGDTAWVRRYNGTGNATDGPYAIAVDNSGSVYVTGKSYSGSADFDFVTIKYLTNGDTAWLRRYNGPANQSDYAQALTLDDAGNVYVTGWSYGIGTNSDYATIMYDSNGDTVWLRRYNSEDNGYDYPSAIEVDDSGYVYVTGYGSSSPYNYDFTTIKYHPNGDTVWIRRYNGPVGGSDMAYDLTVDTYGNVYVAGEGEGTGYTSDYVTVKYYPNGDTAWTGMYDGTGHLGDEANAIEIDRSGSVLVTGLSSGFAGDGDYVTIKYQRNGDTAWVRRYDGGDGGGDGANDIALDDKGNVYVTGLSTVGSTPCYATIRYDANGDLSWIRKYCGTGNGVDVPFAIAVDTISHVYVTGYVYNDQTAEDFATIKYFQALRGDVNTDWVIDIGDVVHLINFLYKGGLPPSHLVIGDCNCDEIVDIGDVVFLINYLFKSGPAPDC